MILISIITFTNTKTDNEKIAEMNHWVDINITQPTQYTFSAWVYTNGPRAELFLYMQDENTTTGPSATSQIQQAPTTLDAWVYVTKTVTVQPNIKKLKLRLDNDGQLTSNTTGYTVWFDDVELRKTNIQSEIIAEDDYYAFGMKHKTIGNVVNGGNDLAQKYKYNGKELQDELGLDMYDYGARFYEPSTGRWFNVDPLAEDYYNYSPYVYTANNPIYYIDPDGKQIIIHYNDDDGKAQTHIYEYGKEYDGNNQFIKDVTSSLNFIIDNKADTTGLIKRLSGHKLGDVNILQNTKENNPYHGNDKMATYFNPDNDSVMWDPEIGVRQEQNSVIDWIMGDGYEHEALVSPAEGLLHEMGHAESWLEDPKKHEKDQRYPWGGGYNNREEHDVITEIERPAGRMFGRKRVRNSHTGQPYRTISPTSVVPKSKKKE